jgi:hypothetical protein
MRLPLGLIGMFGFALATAHAAEAAPTVSSCVGDYGVISEILTSGGNPEHAELAKDFTQRAAALARAGVRAGRMTDASPAAIAALAAPGAARLRAGTETVDDFTARVGVCLSAFPEETVAPLPAKPAPKPAPAPQVAATGGMSVLSCGAHYNAAAFILVSNNQTEQAQRYIEKLYALNKGSMDAGQGDMLERSLAEGEKLILSVGEPGFDLQAFSDRLDVCDRTYPNGAVSATIRTAPPAPRPAPRASAKPDVTTCAAHFAAMGSMMSAIEDKPQKVGPAYLAAAQTMSRTANAAGVRVDANRYSAETNGLLKGLQDGSVSIPKFEAGIDACDAAYPNGQYR